jgi:hypothetical protein
MLLPRRGLLMGLGLFGLLGCGNAEAGNELQLRRTIPHPSNTDAKVEFFLQQPSTPGPQPALILLHGNQPSLPSAGGRAFVQWGELERLSAMGFAVASISLPGFGGSTGPGRSRSRHFPFGTNGNRKARIREHSRYQPWRCHGRAACSQRSPDCRACSHFWSLRPPILVRQPRPIGCRRRTCRVQPPNWRGRTGTA